VYPYSKSVIQYMVEAFFIVLTFNCINIVQFLLLLLSSLNICPLPFLYLYVSFKMCINIHYEVSDLWIVVVLRELCCCCCI